MAQWAQREGRVGCLAGESVQPDAVYEIPSGRGRGVDERGGEGGGGGEALQ